MAHSPTTCTSKSGSKSDLKPTNATGSGSSNTAKLSTTAAANLAASVSNKSAQMDKKQKNLERIVLESNVISAVLQRGSAPPAANKTLQNKKSVPEIFEETKTSMMPSSSFDSDKNPTLRRDKVSGKHRPNMAIQYYKNRIKSR